MAAISEITAGTFQKQVMQADLPVLVDLYATWCPPCKVMGEVLDRLAPRLAGRAKLVKINVDTERELAKAFNVTGVPTLYLLHKGKIIEGVAGLQSAKSILQMIDKVARPRVTATARR